jgi:predicted GH43/DUF377 family glycosyl hydrolase
MIAVNYHLWMLSKRASRFSEMVVRRAAIALSLLLAPAAGFGAMVLKPGDSVAAWPDDAGWITQNAPLFECPDASVQQVYSYRWHVYHRHLVQTPGGWVVTEFLPQVSWAGKYNTISCAAGHHIYEGRWLTDPRYVDDYINFWFHGGGEPRRYSFWAADAVYARYLAGGDKTSAVGLLPELVGNYVAWEKGHLGPDGLFWQTDDRDGMEYSIGGSGYRPTINAYQYGDAAAIAAIARLAGQEGIAAEFDARASRLRSLVQEKLWDPQAHFFKTLPREPGKPLADVRELVGLVPWYFNLPDPHGGYELAWKQIADVGGFDAPFGLTTAERRHPRFNFEANHDCLWNGPSWPFATTQTLVALANLLNNYPQDVVTRGDYFSALTRYARSQFKDGQPHLAEDLDAVTGRWIVDLPRSVDYNHSGYCDLVITGLCGLRPRPDELLEVNPLVPAGAWDWFCLDGVPYHGRSVTILYDKTGDRYHKGTGLRVFADGRLVAAADTIARVAGVLPAPASPPLVAQTQPAAVAEVPTASTQPYAETNGGWVKSPGNPVLGGKLGTCFDVALLKDEGNYRMYFSWRPRKSIALVESKDGTHWSEPALVLGPNNKSDWEADVNRPVVVKRPDGYRMWYTGQSRGRSWIGCATSPDGKAWSRQSDKPVLSPEQSWEKVAVMCPHVVWDEQANLYRMWYSGGEQYEPDAIGYATSPDGLAWTRNKNNPIFAADAASPWEQHKVTACQVVKQGQWWVMFYIGFRDINHARIGIARSKDGISDWQRLAANPIISPGKDRWDADACYKPFAIYDADTSRWMLWYNGRRGGVEQIGLATHEGEALGF